jgi:hypothetical protein
VLREGGPTIQEKLMVLMHDSKEVCDMQVKGPRGDQSRSTYLTLKISTYSTTITNGKFTHILERTKTVVINWVVTFRVSRGSWDEG